MDRYDIWQFPACRLSAMNIVLCYWVGWHTIPKEMYFVPKRINDAYNIGYVTGALEEAAKAKGC